MEQELYDSRSMLEFAGLSLSGPIPDETTILNFRHLLERHQLEQRSSRPSTRTSPRAVCR